MLEPEYKKTLKRMVAERMRADKLPPVLIQVMINRFDVMPSREEIDRARYQLRRDV